MGDPDSCSALVNNASGMLTVVTALVAAVMGVACNPVAYMLPNTSNVIEGESDSDVSAQNEHLAPFTVPHFFWQCSINGLADDFPIMFKALIDHGSHTVLISDKFAASLSLKHRKLLELMPMELAMPKEGTKQIVFLSEWVKLKLYNPSGAWKSKLYMQ
ncbi:hypothetical protein PILCRDRAFT_2731 [Piloderma croceum F 1598]|uniref:Uncharacterized protein n=1 Tax=Piloderma croceum (strain F 1598) TaxID=765440 RepID=A0A0C3BPR3_PILCF|nr:hypothetical protein PILCRDRAFT_2731 [Piloderma croceum F 1598]